MNGFNTDSNLECNDNFEPGFQSQNDFDLPDIAELAERCDFDFDVLEYIKTLNFKLRKWAITNNIRLYALSELLSILKESGHNSLPKDARTLLETPQNVDIVKMGSGQYWYGGLRKKLIEICKKKNCSNVIELAIHIDGTPIYKSSKSEFWPVQCNVNGVDMKAFFVAIYKGTSKPLSAEVFLRPLLNEIHDLIENGLSVSKTELVHVKINKFILDAPARAFLKCIIGHGGYYSCERCEERGEYLCKFSRRSKKPKKSGHVCLLGTNAVLRTDQSFRNQDNPDHHHDSSPLEELPIDMVRDIPLEYLHLILYGVMKRLLILWVDGTKHFKFSSNDVEQISKKHVRAGDTKPTEINRPNRSLNCLSFWKATEFRTFLLKTGPVVLRDHLTLELYNHFLAFHCAVTICCSEPLQKFLPVAKTLFRTFTEKFSDLYGNENYTYSIHSLIHVTDDVARFGVFDKYSAFPGENNLGFLKNLVRGGHLPLQQVIKRIAERDSLEKICEFEENRSTRKDGVEKGIFRINGLRLDSSEKNRWILTKTKQIFKIKRIIEEEKVAIYGEIVPKQNHKNFFELPFSSGNLDIHVVDLTLPRSCTSINSDDMFCKLYRIAVSDNESVFFPLFHYTQ